MPIQNQRYIAIICPLELETSNGFYVCYRKTKFLEFTMASVELQLFPNQKTADLTCQHLRIRITAPQGIIEPSALTELTLPPLVGSQGIVLEGKAPIWIYSCLVHACHASVWVACFDPRLGDGRPRSGGAVVVASHSLQVSVGQILTVYLPEEQR